MRSRSASIVAVLCLLSLAGCSTDAAPAVAPADDAVETARRYSEQVHSGRWKETARQLEGTAEDLARERAAARKEGLATGPSDIRLARLAPEQNAAPIYVQLTRLRKQELIDPRLDDISWRLNSRRTVTPEEMDLARQTLAERRDYLGLVHQASDRTGCDFQRNWALGMAIEFPEAPAFRQAARLLGAESYFLAEAGHFDKAIENQARGFRIAEHAASDPALIPYLVGLAMESITLAGMEEILGMAADRAEVAQRVQETIRTRRPRFRLALDGEIAVMSVWFTRIRKGEPNGLFSLADETMGAAPPSEPLTPEERALWLKLCDAGEADYMQRLRRVRQSLGRPYRERQVILEQMEREGRAPSSNPTHFLRAMLFPMFSQADRKGVGARARGETVMAGAALLAHRARNGAFPARLEEALPQPPPDPFGDGPLRYRREGDGFVVYSIGPTSRFDGGKPGDKRNNGEAAFRYPLPPRTAAPPPDGPEGRLEPRGPR